MSHTKKHQSKSNFMNNILDDIYHPEKPVCQIIQTSIQKKEDCFTQYRPAPETCLDYRISQTVTKMDAGDTKIHVQQTVAEYVPGLSEILPPRPSRKRKYFSGGPPQWQFLDEIFRRQEEEKQLIFKKEFKKRVLQNRREERNSKKGAHTKIIDLVGPAWFQELSPKQVATVDNLGTSILKDLADDTIINTQENIGEFGLVLRPNHRHIRKALKNCCKCPVEFLLVLYQLMNPKRTKYSVNDRLLLSAVVHLTMMDTLQELHIRIPSPPPPPKIIKKSPKMKKAMKYESPYLVPFTFEPEPRKFTGIYCDKHVQRPQSPYFCYLKDLQKMKEQAIVTKDNTSVPQATSEPVHDEIEEELDAAQKIYEDLVDFRPVPVLIKPSKYFPCDNFRNKACTENVEEIEEQEAEELLCIDTPCCVPDEQVRDAETEITEDLSGACNCLAESRNKCFFPDSKCCHEEQEKVCQDESARENLVQDTASIKNLCNCGFNKPDTCIENVEAKMCDIKERQNVCQDNPIICQKAQSLLPCNDLKPCQNEAMSNSCKCEKTTNLCGLSSTKKLTLNECLKDEDDETEKKKCKHAQDLEIYDKFYDVIRPNSDKRKPCKCKEKHRQFIETPLCPCEKCEEERKKKSIAYVISGLKETDSKEVVSIIDRVVTEKPCKCLQQYEKKIQQYEEDKEEIAKRSCNCRREAKRLIETPLCECEKCKEDRRIKAAKFIISGIKEAESEHLRIIEGISTGKPCECIKNYEKRANEYEAFQKRKALVSHLKEQEQKFVIGGIVSTPKGPVYIISGMRPQIDCKCAKKEREEIAEKHMLAIMPQLPPGRVQYDISGVKETPKGNVYILNNALPIDDCGCMKLYHKYEQQHATCNNLYEQYLAKMKDEYSEFMKDVLPPNGNEMETKVEEGEGEEKDTDVPEQEETKKSLDDLGEQTEDSAASELKQTISQISEKPPAICESVKSVCEMRTNVCKCGNLSYLVCCNCKKTQEVNDCIRCSCGGELIECVDCTCSVQEEEETVEEICLKRFFIFKKILCNHKWQIKVIKKALQSMAEDGFPLAKLPECYRLPHFKLWMQMRCGKFWTKQDRYDYVFKSLNSWRHTDSCPEWTTKCSPELSITKSEAQLLNWSKADYCRKLVNTYLEKFYRKVKQNRIHFGREFFATTYSYEFPFKTWRDCYFAYTPTKEEEALARFAWKKYEFKSFAEMQRFCG